MSGASGCDFRAFARLAASAVARRLRRRPGPEVGREHFPWHRSLDQGTFRSHCKAATVDSDWYTMLEMDPNSVRVPDFGCTMEVMAGHPGFRYVSTTLFQSPTTSLGGTFSWGADFWGAGPVGPALERVQTRYIRCKNCISRRGRPVLEGVLQAPDGRGRELLVLNREHIQGELDTPRSP